ncbi:type VI secretion system Vgr family protein [Ningiella sp. W23]|uniref:type VI secretion system Vgr family protein n=1 Tax=Ningiella sp. W23 TaxID=3023715 RepID=UPI0037567096
MSFGSNEEFMFFEVTDPIDFKVASLSGTEGMSMLYHFDLEVLSEDADIAFDDMIGKACVITIQGNHHTEEAGAFSEASLKDRFIHGVISDFVIQDEGEKFTSYNVNVVPKIWPMKHRVNSRIFQKQSIHDIVKTLLDELGLEGDEYRWDCRGNFAPIEYCVQYLESEFDFISRLLEEEGIFYFFEHQNDKHVLVFSNDSSSCKPIEDEDPLTYISDVKGMVSNQHITKFFTKKSLTPGKVTYKDYNFLKPTLKLEFESNDEKSLPQEREREVFQYGYFDEKGRGEHLANVRLESLATFKELGRGTCNINRLCPGFLIEIDDQRRGNYSGEYLVTQVNHEGTQQQAYQQYANAEGSRYNNHFECIPAQTVYRPSIVTKRPTVHGAQTAIVSGPKGEEIYTDDQGRVKVQFHWDRYGKSDEQSSCWVRVSQMWAGQGYGGFSLPRIGQEVIVDFINGNPDDPIITGRVHHADNRSPYRLPAKKTITTFKTQSTVGGEGFNELRFDDEKGNEQIFVHAERNKDARIKNDQFEFVGNDDHQKVINDQYLEVGNDKHEVVKNDSFKQVTGETHNSFDADFIQTTKGNEHYDISGDRMTGLKGSDNLKSDMDIKLDTGMNYGLKTGAKVDMKAGATINIEGASVNLKAGGSFINITPSGIYIKGPTVMLNSGGSAASASPSKPGAPATATLPKAPAEADKAEAGKVESTQDNSMPIKPSSYGPQARAVKASSRAGAPFCEQCDAAK